MPASRAEHPGFISTIRLSSSRPMPNRPSRREIVSTRGFCSRGRRSVTTPSLELPPCVGLTTSAPLSQRVSPWTPFSGASATCAPGASGWLDSPSYTAAVCVPLTISVAHTHKGQGQRRPWKGRAMGRSGEMTHLWPRPTSHSRSEGDSSTCHPACNRRPWPSGSRPRRR